MAGSTHRTEDRATLRRAAIALLPAGLVLLVHLGTLSALGGGDSADIYGVLQSGRWIRPPHELSHAPLRLGMVLGTALGLSPYQGSAAVCALATSVSAGLLASLVHLRTGRAGLAVAAALAWAVALTPWRMGTTLEVHAVPVAVVLAAVWLLHRRPDRRQAMAVGVLAGLLPLVHLLSLAAVPALLVAVVASPGPGRWVRGLVASAAAVAVTMGLHLALWAMAPASLPGLSPLWPVAVSELPLQAARVPIPVGHPVFMEWLGGLASAWHAGPPGEPRGWVMALALASILVVAWGLLRAPHIARAGPPGATAAPLAAAALWAAGLYVEPNNSEYHLIPLAMVVLEGACLAGRAPRLAATGALALLGAALALTNAALIISSRADPGAVVPRESPSRPPPRPPERRSLPPRGR